jgi:hypothetical protein
VLRLVYGASRKVVRLSGCDLEHFWRERRVWIGNKVCREGDWRISTAERLDIINTWVCTKGSHLKEDRTVSFFGEAFEPA